MWSNSPSHTPASHRLHLWSGQSRGRRSSGVQLMPAISEEDNLQCVTLLFLLCVFCVLFSFFCSVKFTSFFHLDFVNLPFYTFRWGSVSHWIFGDKGGRTLSPLEWSGAMLKLRQNYLGEMWHHKGLTKIEESGISLSPKSQRLDLTFELGPPSVNWPHLLKSLPHHFITSFQFHLWPPTSVLRTPLCSNPRRGGRSHRRRSLLELASLFSFLFFFFFAPMRTDGSQLIVNLIFEMFLEVCSGTVVFYLIFLLLQFSANKRLRQRKRCKRQEIKGVSIFTQSF